VCLRTLCLYSTRWPGNVKSSVITFGLRRESRETLKAVDIIAPRRDQTDNVMTLQRLLEDPRASLLFHTEMSD
jgi:hypothetical protein